MSKAFTSEEAPDEPLIVPPRAPLPRGVPNYVTLRGFGRLRDELAQRTLERAAHERGSGDGRAREIAVATAQIVELEHRIASATLVDPALQPHDQVRFGAVVTVRDQAGAEHVYQVVGVDEADAALGRVAFVAPVARALLGKRVGEAAVVRAPHGDEELCVLAIAYDDSRGPDR